jgi:calmodulin
LRLCEEAFDLFDKDGDGTMDTNELKHLLRCFEREFDEDTIKKLVQKYDSSGSGNLSFPDIVEILKPEFK